MALYLGKYDTIKLNKEDLERLLKWRDNNKNLVRNFNPSLMEGVIEFGGHYKQYFKDSGYRVEQKVFIGSELKLHLLWNKLFKTVEVKLYNPLEGYPQDEAIKDCLTVHASLMAYMEHYRDDSQRVKRKTISNQNNNPKKKKNKKAKSTIKIGKHYNYSINITKEQSEEKAEKRKYTKPTGSFNVRGFWRNQRYGKGREQVKRIWIDSYPKGEGKKIKKVYKM